MANQWDGKSYDQDWYEVDAQGQRVSGEKDWAAHDAALGTKSNVPATTQPAAAPAAPTGPTSDWQGLSDAVMGSVKGDIGLDGTVNTADPAYRQQVQANQLQTDRAADRARAAAVQRRAATGTGSSGAVDTDVNKVLADQALQDKNFEATLMDKFRQQNLDRQARALQLGSGMLTAEQERQLRGALTREGYDVQRDLAADDLAYRRDALGQQLALSQADLDQRAMLALLGG